MLPVRMTTEKRSVTEESVRKQRGHEYRTIISMNLAIKGKTVARSWRGRWGRARFCFLRIQHADQKGSITI